MSEIPGLGKIVKCEVEMMRERKSGRRGCKWEVGVRGGDEGLG